ncbi:hypothetical protein GQX74_002625 [Glossina fuscipes]|nr:hypothetical protein GQX74_002625 [Glossina fuscipes]
MLLGKNKDLTIAATGNSKKKHSKYDKYINETHIPLIPDEAIQSLSESDMLKVEKRMERRRKVLLDKCSELGLDVVGTDPWHKPNPWEFLVNKKYHIIWCNVFKAASSSWMFNFNILAARHPFERLLSAYRDKFMFAVPHSFHDKLGRKIIRTYRRKGFDNHAPKHPTFPEFIRWLLDQVKQGNYLDMHFVASTRFCTPCLINFDIIMKFETLEEDQLYLIEKTGLKRVIAPEWRNMGKGKNTLELLLQFFSQLTRRELDGLYDYYRYDFELFDYSVASYYNIAKPNEIKIPEAAAVALGKVSTSAKVKA